MTISTTRTRELSIDKIVLLAYRHAGLLNETQSASETKKAAARDVLETIVDELQIKGLYARSIVFETVQLTTGTETYSLSTDILDVIDSGAYISATEPDPTHAQGETVVSQIDRAEWQRISDKGATGRPALFYSDRTAFPVRVNAYYRNLIGRPADPLGRPVIPAVASLFIGTAHAAEHVPSHQPLSQPKMSRCCAWRERKDDKEVCGRWGWMACTPMMCECGDRGAPSCTGCKADS